MGRLEQRLGSQLQVTSLQNNREPILSFEMKKYILASFLLSVASSAFASIQFSGTAILNSGAGTIWDSGTLAVYVVDTNNDGFAASSTGVLSVGDSVTAGSAFGSADDLVLFTVGTQGNNSTIAVVGGGTFNVPSGAVTNDNFAIFVFDDETSAATQLTTAGTYGFFTSQGIGSGDWDLPADGETWGFQSSPSGSNFQQLSGVTGGSLSVVPEPSSFALLAGVFGLAWIGVRRRK